MPERADVLQMAFCFGLNGFRQCVQNIAGLVHPAALFAGLSKHLAQGIPEAGRAVTNGQVGGLAQAAVFQVQQQFAPALTAFAIALHKARNVLASPFIRANYTPAYTACLHPCGV